MRVKFKKSVKVVNLAVDTSASYVDFLIHDLWSNVKCSCQFLHSVEESITLLDSVIEKHDFAV